MKYCTINKRSKGMLVFARSVVISIAIVIIVHSVGVGCGLAFFALSWASSHLSSPCSSVSAMSHPNSGIFLFDTVFFSFSDFTCLFLFIQLTDFFYHNYLLNVSAMDLSFVTMVVFDFYLVLSQQSNYTKVFVFGLECF